MSDNNTNTVLLKMDPNNAWGLNIVNSQYAEEVKNINKSLQSLMAQYSNSISWGAKALYSVGGAMFLGSICEAAANIGGAGSALYAGRESGAIEKECTPEIEKLDSQIKQKDEEINKASTPKEQKELESARDLLRSQKDRFTNKIQAGYARTNTKMSTLQMMSQGLGAIPKGMQESLQQKGQADKGAFDAVSHQTGAAYDTSKSTLRGFLDVDYFAGLITLANIQFR